MNKHLKDLPLSIPTGSIIEAFCFDAKTTTALQKWLNDEQIEALRDCTEFEKHRAEADKNDPKLPDERLVLQSAAELASALAKILEQAPPRASAELDLVFQKQFGDWRQKEITAVRLNFLSFAIERRLHHMPLQERRKSPVFFVRQIAEVLQAAGIKPSVAENSRFFKICAILFESIGIYQSPAAPIRAYLKK